MTKDNELRREEEARWPSKYKMSAKALPIVRSVHAHNTTRQAVRDRNIPPPFIERYPQRS